MAVLLSSGLLNAFLQQPHGLTVPLDLQAGSCAALHFWATHPVVPLPTLPALEPAHSAGGQCAGHADAGDVVASTRLQCVYAEASCWAALLKLVVYQCTMLVCGC